MEIFITLVTPSFLHPNFGTIPKLLILIHAINLSNVNLNFPMRILFLHLQILNVPLNLQLLQTRRCPPETLLRPRHNHCSISHHTCLRSSCCFPLRFTVTLSTFHIPFLNSKIHFLFIYTVSAGTCSPSPVPFPHSLSLPPPLLRRPPAFISLSESFGRQFPRLR